MFPENEKRGYSIATRAIMDNTMLKNIGFIPLYDYEKAIQRTLLIQKV
jgi:hypothetical protein